VGNINLGGFMDRYSIIKKFLKRRCSRYIKLFPYLKSCATVCEICHDPINKQQKFSGSIRGLIYDICPQCYKEIKARGLDR
jgi:hypothetical protein